MVLSANAAAGAGVRDEVIFADLRKQLCLQKSKTFKLQLKKEMNELQLTFEVQVMEKSNVNETAILKLDSLRLVSKCALYLSVLRGGCRYLLEHVRSALWSVELLHTCPPNETKCNRLNNMRRCPNYVLL